MRVIPASWQSSSALKYARIIHLICHDTLTQHLFVLLSGPAAAGLRRSFRLSRKDRQGSSGDSSDPGDSDFMTYEEVTRYQQKPHERPRLVVLIGEAQMFLFDDSDT